METINKDTERFNCQMIIQYYKEGRIIDYDSIYIDLTSYNQNTVRKIEAGVMYLLNVDKEKINKKINNRNEIEQDVGVKIGFLISKK
jgi:hypothetical protein